MFKSQSHNLFFLESLVLIRGSEAPRRTVWMCECVWLTSRMCVCVCEIKRGWEPTCGSSCLCFSTHSLHFSSPQVFPVPSVYSTVAGRRIASPLCVLSPSNLWELIYRVLDLSARSDRLPCQRILPFRNGGGGGKVMSEFPQKSLEQFRGCLYKRCWKKGLLLF